MPSKCTNNARPSVLIFYAAVISFLIKQQTIVEISLNLFFKRNQQNHISSNRKFQNTTLSLNCPSFIIFYETYRPSPFL